MPSAEYCNNPVLSTLCFKYCYYFRLRSNERSEQIGVFWIQMQHVRALDEHVRIILLFFLLLGVEGKTSIPNILSEAKCGNMA